MLPGAAGVLCPLGADPGPPPQVATCRADCVPRGISPPPAEATTLPLHGPTPLPWLVPRTLPPPEPGPDPAPAPPRGLPSSTTRRSKGLGERSSLESAFRTASKAAAAPGRAVCDGGNVTRAPEEAGRATLPLRGGCEGTLALACCEKAGRIGVVLAAEPGRELRGTRGFCRRGDVL